MRSTHLLGARTHNLANVSLDLVPGELVVLTGVSGAGKSSLALDTLYAEGQRRYIESFSPYARQFLERLERPDVDVLDPVPAGVAVDRKAPVKSSRSTVATMADLEPYLSALFTREARPVCPDCGATATWTDPKKAAERATKSLPEGRAIVTYAVRAGGTADYLEVRERLAGEGYRRVLVGGAVRDLDEVKPSEVLGEGKVSVVVDRVDTSKKDTRLAAALEEAWRRGEGVARITAANGDETNVARGLSCPNCAKTFEPARASLFSYQSPVGACASCRGFGRTIGIDWNKVIPNPALSLKRGAIKPWSGKSTTYERGLLAKWCQKRGIPFDAPWSTLTEAQKKDVIEGEGTWNKGKFPGLKAWFAWLETRTYKMHVRVLLSRFRAYDVCASCHGARLNESALSYRVAGKHLAGWHELEIRDAFAELEALKTTTGQGEIARRELSSRLSYLVDVGLGYLTLDRQARTLSGGEAQRVSLTAALGTSLTGALFVLDEPTVGLHPSDVPPLSQAMRTLAARGNTVVAIEHDTDVVAAADRAIELGPGAGRDGGRVLFDGTPKDLAKRIDLPTGRALAEKSKAPPKRRTPTSWLTITNAHEHNLRNVNVSLPLGVVCAVTGPSGSGKSTLIRDIVYRATARARGDHSVDLPGAHDRIEGVGAIKEVVFVDQSPLGRTSRGNAATYTKAWDRIRAIYAAEPTAKAQGIDAACFSFNVAGGRCEACSGEGAETIEMQFLADVSLVCAECHGRRFQPRVLSVKHQGLDVAAMLEQPVSKVLDMFPDDRALVRALRPVEVLGLGYLPLGQPLSTLSGGEAQRLKLARALSAPTPGALFLLDEPSAGLHAADVDHVVSALSTLASAGASVVVVEHDLSLVRAADWIVDLGPGAGRHGGNIVAQGTPEDLVAKGEGKTADALRAATKAPIFAANSRVSKRDGVPTTLVVDHAREHNLHEVSCEIPLGKLVVFTGPSGSGKSTLAFDVVFSEGQRRFLETLTPYARQFLPMMPRADVDRVTGVPPSIALEQRTTRAGANSTVATVTEVAHYLRLLYAKLGDVHCPSCGAAVTSKSADEVFSAVVATKGKASLYAPAVRARKGTYLDVFTSAARAGFAEAICDGERVSTDTPPKLKKALEHTIDIVVAENESLGTLTRERFDKALSLGEGALRIEQRGKSELLSTTRTCGSCGAGVPEIDPRWFSFNTKQGQCAACEGSGIEGGPTAALEPGAKTCKACEGSRLAPLPRSVRLFGKRYHEVMGSSVLAARKIVEAWRFEGNAALLGSAAHGEIVRRLKFLADVGLGYLSLGRAAISLSGGEMQRLRLSAQLGSGLTGAMYVLDEPTIGLHPRDTRRLLDNLRALVDLGSTVLVVEHDVDTIRAADHVIDLGPSGGRQGGRIVASGAPSSVLASPQSPTARAVAVPFTRPRPERPKQTSMLRLTGARANNLANVDLAIPHQRMTVVAGVSGSGKSTLIQKVLLPAVKKSLKLATLPPGAFDKLENVGEITRAIAVDQSPIGRTPRSVPATFLSIWDEIRRIYASTPDAQVAGFSASRFSFNTPSGGRCPTCDGQGVITHEMAFLPDVVAPCDECGGLRFEPRTLDIRYLGRNVGEVLRMTASEAVEHFHAHPRITRPLRTLDDLGVGYLQLGQGSHTLSGGEAQRLKLAAELTAGSRHEPTLYVLDEPTTGLHLGDVAKLSEVLARLVDRGDTLVVIEHHPWVIASADHVVELGPEGGEGGGRIVATGTPRELAKAKTATAPVVRELLEGEITSKDAGKKPRSRSSEAAPEALPVGCSEAARSAGEPRYHRPRVARGGASARSAMNEEEWSREELLDEVRALRKRVEAERELTDELLRRVFERSAAIKLLIDPDTGRIVDANLAASSFYGFSIEDLRKRKITDLNTLPPEEIAAEMAEAASEQRTYFRFPHRIASGEVRDVEVYSGSIRIHDRELLLSIIHDVTALEHAKTELGRSEAFLRTLMEALPVGVGLHRDHRFIYANPAIAKMLGYASTDEVVGQLTADVVHPDDRSLVVEHRKQVLERGERVPRAHQRLLRRDGSVLDAEILGLPVEIDGQKAVLTVTSDVTEKVNLEEQLRRSQRMEAVGRLAGGVAHDFNNLLFVILNSAQYLGRKMGVEPPVPELEQITAAAKRAADLTRQLLLFSRGVEMKAEVLELNAVVVDITRLLRGTLGEEVELRTLLTGITCGVKVARANIEQVLVNLAVNARDAMPEGGTLTIETSVVDVDTASARMLVGLLPGRYVRLVVSDTGIGMTQEIAAHAFDPFFTTKELGRGTGLGLAITYGIVQKAGGHIAVASQPGAGATFTVHLPRVEIIPEIEIARPSDPTSAESTGETVLLVEDEGAVRAVVERSLCDAGYHVLVAPGPGEALLTAEQHEGAIDLLLTDIIMPRMSGTELAERLVKRRPAMHVLYMSGYAGEALARRGVKEQDVNLLNKPFTESELLVRVRKTVLGR